MSAVHAGEDTTIIDEAIRVGVVWWPQLDALCRPAEGLVELIELEPEAFWRPCWSAKGATVTYASTLQSGLSHLPQPKVLHGVGAPLGGSTPESSEHAQVFAADVRALRPLWVSEHLSFARFERADGVCAGTGFLLPPAQTPEAVRIAADNIRARRAALKLDVAFETGVNYLPPLSGEISDGEFVASIAEAADCGILLDLHNIVCNERNGRQKALDFCASLPLERVWEVHLAGGEQLRNFWLDAHSGLADDALLELALGLIGSMPNLRAVVLEIMPDRIARVGLRAIEGQLVQLHELCRAATPQAIGSPAPRGGVPAGIVLSQCSVREWEAFVGGAVSLSRAPACPAALCAWLDRAQPAIAMYRELVGEARASSLVPTAARTIPTLLQRRGKSATRALLAAFWDDNPPAYTVAEEASAFFAFLATGGILDATEAEAMRLDRAELTAFFGSSSKRG